MASLKSKMSTTTAVVMDRMMPFQSLSVPSDAADFRYESRNDVALQITQDAPMILVVVDAQSDHVVQIFHDIGLLSELSFTMMCMSACTLPRLRRVGPERDKYEAADPTDPSWDFLGLASQSCFGA